MFIIEVVFQNELEFRLDQERVEFYYLNSFHNFLQEGATTNKPRKRLSVVVV